MKGRLTLGFLVFLAGCQKPVVVPTPATPMAAARAPIGEAVAGATTANLPLIGQPIVAVTNPPPGFTDVTFASIPGTLPPGPGVLGFVSPLGQYVALGLDTSIILDTTSAAYPVLKVPENPVVYHVSTSRGIFTPRADGTWSCPATFDVPLPVFDALVQLYRNGLLLDDPGDYSITYDGANLVVTPKGSPWPAVDVVRGTWVQ